MRLTFVPLVLSAALAGCVGSGTAGVQYSGDVAMSTPDLVEVSPGVQVVADYDDSVFYSDGFYWRYDSGGWYRSNNYAGGFVYWNAPPAAIVSINEPGRYRHYRPTGYQPHHQPYRHAEPIVRDHRQPERRPEPVREPEVRDHRETQPRPEPMHAQPQPEVRDHREPEHHEAPAPAPAPVVRDHRETEHHEAPAPVVRDHRENNAPPPRPSPGQGKHDHDHDHH